MKAEVESRERKMERAAFAFEINDLAQRIFEIYTEGAKGRWVKLGLEERTRWLSTAWGTIVYLAEKNERGDA